MNFQYSKFETLNQVANFFLWFHTISKQNVKPTAARAIEDKTRNAEEAIMNISLSTIVAVMVKTSAIPHAIAKYIT